MTDAIAKLISLKILLDWKSRSVWCVRHPISDGMSDYRWFKSEDAAIAYAALLRHAVIEECSVPSTFVFPDDDLLTALRSRVVSTLDRRARVVSELGYRHDTGAG